MFVTPCSDWRGAVRIGLREPSDDPDSVGPTWPDGLAKRYPSLVEDPARAPAPPHRPPACYHETVFLERMAKILPATIVPETEIAALQELAATLGLTARGFKTAPRRNLEFHSETAVSFVLEGATAEQIDRLVEHQQTQADPEGGRIGGVREPESGLDHG